VLDHVQARRVLEQPTGKHSPPFEVGAGISPLANKHLNEGALFGTDFPRGGFLASRQAHDNVADAARFARLHLEILRNVVALVKQAERRHALVHRRAHRVPVGDNRRCILDQFFGHLGLDRLGRGRLTVAGSERQQEQGNCNPAHDQASGVQAS
jgi:hypothetical protein